MRRLLPVFVTLGLLVTLALPVQAAAGSGPPPPLSCHPADWDFQGEPSTGPCTETDHFSDGSFIGNPLNCSGPAPFATGWVFGSFPSGNGVQHMTVNSAGDFWATFTFTGTGTFFPVTPPPTFSPDPSRPSATGKITEWFGIQGNLKNFSFSDTTHFIGTINPPFPVQTVDMHFNNHVSSTPQNPMVPHTQVHDLSCS